jgi:hypothetical protein
MREFNATGDRRFFRDDECFAHLLRGKLAKKNCIVNTGAISKMKSHASIESKSD